MSARSDRVKVIEQAEKHVRAGRVKDALAEYEKLALSDPQDVGTLNIVGDLYIRLGHNDRAIGFFLKVAEEYERRGLFSLALATYKKIHKLNSENVDYALKLGDLYGQQGFLADAKNVYMAIAGRLVEAEKIPDAIAIFEKIIKLDQAYELSEPPINNLVKKPRDEKASGLLGLILESQKPHLPALERLALICRSNKEMKKLEVVDRAILDELRKQGDKGRMVAVYSELLELRPDDADIAREARDLRLEKGLPEEKVREETPELSKKDLEALQEGMAQADLYMQQGLVRISRRLLENLRFRYPEAPQILRKIAVLDEVGTHMDEEEIRRRVEKTGVLDAKFKEKTAENKAEDRKTVDRKKTAGPFTDAVLEGEKVSTADIFAETDILPFVNSETGEKKYYDLKALAVEELRLLAAAHAQQLQGDMSQYERELSGIVAEFRKDLRAKVEGDAAETHYQLGLAFMGQGLTGEAVEELTQAAKDKKLAIDSYCLISQCYRQKRNHDEAGKWLKLALAAAKPGTDQYYALLYELAEIHEESDDREKAIALFKQIHEWNPVYRNISTRLESLEKESAV